MATYTIPELPRSLNDFVGRKNVWEYRAEKNRWKLLCRSFCRCTTPPKKARVEITFYFPTRHRHDADNYQKLLLDGMVYAGAIMDDDFDHVEVLCRGEHDKNNPRTEITVTEIE